MTRRVSIRLGPSWSSPPGPCPGAAGHRLGRLRYTDGNAIFDLAALYGNMLDTPCYATIFSDRSVRCLPASGLTAASRYSDSACEHLIYIAKAPPACWRQALPTYAVNVPAVCPSRVPISDSPTSIASARSISATSMSRRSSAASWPKPAGLAICSATRFRSSKSRR
jgi:hypothetical protein